MPGRRAAHRIRIRCPLTATDPLAWNSVQTIATPAWFSDYVLSVSATDSAGAPLTGQAASLHGPWVGLAAPGTDIVGLSTSGQLINGSIENDALKPIAGSSFAAAFVSGIAALVRAKYPELSAHQVIRRLQATAHPPAGGRDSVVGYGVVDPVAALTWDVPPGDWLAPGVRMPLHIPPEPPAPDPAPALGHCCGRGCCFGGGGRSAVGGNGDAAARTVPVKQPVFSVRGSARSVVVAEVAAMVAALGLIACGVGLPVAIGVGAGLAVLLLVVTVGGLSLWQWLVRVMAWLRERRAPDRVRRVQRRPGRRFHAGCPC